MAPPDQDDDEEKRASTRATVPANGLARKIELEGLKDRYVGTTLAGRYRVLSKLGQGGMGAVYAAEHVLIEKKVAIKVLSNQHSKELLRRFAQEAKAASRIGHENIIDITDFGETDEGVAFLAMEHLEGRDLGHEVRTKGSLTTERAANIMYQVCRALSAAHDKGIVHRDLKPDNVFLVAREGNPDFVKVLDFGLARVTNLEPGQRLTKSGAVLGTPEYMAPEQVLGEPVDARADVYSAGCMLYELLTAEIPFAGGNYMLVLQKHLQTPPEPPSKIMPGISAALDAVVLKAMAKAPSKRFQSMKDLALAICAAQGDDPRQVWSVEQAPAKETPTVQSATVSWAESRRLGGRAWPLWAGIGAVTAIAGAMLWWSRPSAQVMPAPIQVAPSPASTGLAAAPAAAVPAVVAAPSPAVATSHLSIVSEPPGAEVARDGTLLGKTPLDLDLPSASAPFDVTVSHHGYKEESFRVQPDQNHQYRLRLAPAPARHAKPSEPVSHPAPSSGDKKASPELKDVFGE